VESDLGQVRGVADVVEPGRGFEQFAVVIEPGCQHAGPSGDVPDAND